VAVSWVAGHPTVGTGARYAGVVMAGGYAVVRGITLGRETSGQGTSVPDGELSGNAWLVATRLVPPDLLRGYLAGTLAGGAWLLAARLVLLAGGLWGGPGLPGLFRSPAPGLAFALTATAVLTVLLATVAVALPHGRAAGGSGGADPTGD
jgi:hypothetical protein